ncbi:hypothetical protein SSX86_008992 [Deinandra increscens subsp. villosa]|uniref:ATP-dependent DNA helicase n=1 Tax=Deinandra increscens subsp. villosa TaxID=3103831 RepID=A0AAP0DGG2_9ASTR
MSSNRKRRNSNSVDENLGRQSSRQTNTRATLSRQHSVTSANIYNVNHSVAGQSSTQSHVHVPLPFQYPPAFSYIDNGDCDFVCSNCYAMFWYDERLSSSNLNDTPRYNQCCKGGDIRLPFFPLPPMLFKHLFDQPDFLDNVRRYNSVFSMTSFGANVDESVYDGGGPYIFKVEGQICHKIGSLCPVEGKKPSFLQLYIYDCSNEISNRLSIFEEDGRPVLNASIISSIVEVLDSCNELVRLFRTAKELTSTCNPPDFAICLFNSQYQMSYDLPTPGCIGAILYGPESSSEQYDIVLHPKDGVLRRVSNLHPSYMPLQYPLLFPYGESGWSSNLKFESKGKTRQLTMNMYYSFFLHDRVNVYSHLLRGGRLFQQFIVDAYVCIEHGRLEYFRSNQKKFRNELLQGIEDAIAEGDTVGHEVGKRTFLPSSFTGGPRYMYKHYQDALAICRVYGNPQYFITFTCNVKWPEIQRYMSRYPMLKAQDKPEIVSRVFQIKLKAFIKFLKVSKPFGDVSAYVYTVEFQKRGLPHCHFLIWVTDPFKIRNPDELDRYISAEIPDPVSEPELYKIVTDFMIHGPCGKMNTKAVCMSNGNCSKKYPKGYEESTIIDKNGYPRYMRRENRHTFTRNKFRIDNGYVVPYNRTLSLRFNAHINVEYCGWSMLIKYLFKYISKGADRIRFSIRNASNSSTASHVQRSRNIDEIQSFLDGRFICPHEACWRILNFDIHQRDPAVQILAVHLENMQNITFTDSESLENIAQNPYLKKTTLTGWLSNNVVDSAGRHLRYIDFVSEYRWDASDRMWYRRSRQHTPTIGRLTYIHPSCGESFYLRMLLSHQKGCTSFSDIRTVNGEICTTYRKACEKLGLLGDNREWLSTLEEASAWCTSLELRSLFIHMLLYCEITNPLELWTSYWHKMSDDLIYIHGFINPEDLQEYVLYEIELAIKTLAPSNSVINYGLPLPNARLIGLLHNKLLMEEKNYDREKLRHEHESLHRGLHVSQLEIYDYVMNTLASNEQVLLFVYGHGGTGKTYLWNTIISALRSVGDVVLAVAASGIASLLLPSGRTAHSRFRIPIKITETSVCNITKKTQLSKLLEETKLIVWDEAPMSERNSLEALDRTLKDILCDTREFQG